MTRLGKVFSKFYGGEFSQWLRGQYDLTSYQYALDTLYNTNVQIYGPLTRRMGTVMITKTEESSGKLPVMRPIPFVVNEDVVYVLLIQGEEGGKSYMNVLNPDGSFVLNSDGNRYRLNLPFSTEDIQQLHYAQSSDILFIVHPEYAPQQLSHYGSTNWTIAAMDLVDGPYFAENADDTRTFALSNIEEQANQVKITASFDAFSSADVGRLIRIQRKADPDNDAEGTEYRWHSLKIQSFTDAKNVVCTTKETKVSSITAEEGLYATIPATPNWRLGSFGKAPGYPTAITFHQERLWMGGTKSQPQTVWSSVSSDFSNFAPTDEVGDVLDDSSIVLTMLSDEVNNIQWMKSDVVLNVGTFGAEFKIFTYSAESVLSPSTAQAQRVTSLGSEPIEPVSMPIGTVFVQRSGRRLRHAIFTNSLTDDQTPSDLNIWASHIADVGFKKIVFQKEPNSMLWGIMNNGALASLTYDPTQKVMAWARHKLAGRLSEAVDMCSIPYKQSLQFRMFFVVDRIINGKKCRCVEYMANEVTDKTRQELMVYTDFSFCHANIFTVTGFSFNENTGEIRVTIDTNSGTAATQNNTKGIITSKVTFNNKAVFKIFSPEIVEPDLPNDEYTRQKKLSEVLAGRAITLSLVSGNTYKVMDKYGKDLNSTFKGCYNDIGELSQIAQCVSEVTGLNNLEGETVQLLGDGAVLESQKVTNGKVTLRNTYGYVNIGLGYRSKIKTLPVAVKTASEETTNMWTLKIIRAFVNIYKSLGFKYGVEEETLSVEPFRSTKERMDEATPLVTGVKEITVGDVTENKGQIILIQDQPLPLNVLSVGLTINATDV